MRKYRYGGSGIVDMIGSLLARYATESVLPSSAKMAMRGTLDASKRAVPHLIPHKVASTIAAAAKKRKRVDTNTTKPMLRMKALNPTNTMNINRLLVHNLIVLDRLQ